MQIIVKCGAGALAMAAVLATAAPAHAIPIGVDESLTITNADKPIIAANNPFEYIFAGLPTVALTDATLNFTAFADLQGVDEQFSVTVDGVSFGDIFLDKTGFDEGNPATTIASSFVIGLAEFSTFLADGQIDVVLNATSAVNTPR